MDDLLARTPEDWSDEITEAIADAVMSRTSMALESLDIGELEPVLERCGRIDAAPADARRLIALRLAQDGRL